MGMVVNFFFTGFVLGKIPFPLSPRFKLMLQRGLDLVSLDVSYFTSLSFYILLLFGLRGVFSLIFRYDVLADRATSVLTVAFDACACVLTSALMCTGIGMGSVGCANVPALLSTVYCSL
jgi:hypothetical protein